MVDLVYNYNRNVSFIHARIKFLENKIALPCPHVLYTFPLNAAPGA